MDRKHTYDVVIVGAGPGGLQAAYVLAKHRRKVVVLEKNKVVGPKVCAAGLTTKTMRFGIPNHLIERFFTKAYFQSGYAWVFPYHKGASVGAAMQINMVDKGYPQTLKQALLAWAQKWGIDFSKGKLEGWTINYDYQGHAFGNVYLIGCAAGLASALTGEGIYAAMVSGDDVAKKIIDPTYQCPGIQELLRINKKYEKFLRILQWNRLIRLMCFYVILPLSKTKRFSARMIQAYC